MNEDKIIELAIQGHASTRDAIRWAIQQEREACAKLCDHWPYERDDIWSLGQAIRARGEKPWVKSYCGGKPNYCTPEETPDVDAVNTSQESVDETAKSEHDLWIAAACLKSTVEAAIKAGDWKVDGACDPTIDLVRLRQALAEPANSTTNLVEPKASSQTEQEPVACKHSRYSVDAREQTGNCYDCGAEGRMRFVVDDTTPAPAQTEQEPVAWMTHTNDLLPLFHKTRASALNWQTQPTPLYTAPPKRELVGLTHEERDEIDQSCRSQMEALFAIEAKLKEKNS